MAASPRRQVRDYPRGARGSEGGGGVHEQPLQRARARVVRLRVRPPAGESSPERACEQKWIRC
eukprot:6212313-Pleurochrysis_carterae.AAC.16